MGREELLKLVPIPKLPAYLDQVDATMKKTVAGGQFEESITQLLQRGGKRLRPMLLIASARLSGKPIDKPIILAAAATELIHEASLIHDDIIDDDSQLELSQALLMGDYLISVGLGTANAVSAEAVGLLANAIKLMAEGQAQQLTARYRADAADEFYIKNAKNKAGALFAAAGELGGLGSPDVSALREYGEAFGVAFQIIDDIVDQDFSSRDLPAAKIIAQKHISLAKNSLKSFPDSPLKWSLVEIPNLLLEMSLPS